MMSKFATMWNVSALIAIAVGIPLLLAQGCRNSDHLVIFAAASLRDPLTLLAQEFESQNHIDVQFNFAGSNTLSQQIARGAPGDIFMAAGAHPIEVLRHKGLVTEDDPGSQLTNRLVIVTPNDMSYGIVPFDEIMRRSKRIAVADPHLSPAGSYTMEALHKTGIWEHVQPKIVFGSDVRMTLAYVESGNVDSGFVYETDAAQNSRVKIASVVPDETYTPIIYPFVIIQSSDNERLARHFLSFINRKLETGWFKSYGFGVINNGS